MTAKSALTTTCTAGEAAGRRPAAAQFLARRGTGTDLRPAVSGGIGPSPVRPLGCELGGERQGRSRPTGTGAGEGIPATWEAAIDSLATAVVSELKRDPAELIGHSAGGAVVHAVARRIESDGGELAGLAVINSSVPESTNRPAASAPTR
ncbi:thioesterase domain-containing protein [Streptomyces halstedii]|uniref:Thioesterase domain-containing protein n=1 Tax=Streptomyces halstedii TaxID=1944 RepID=A0A6N9U7W3_STRHA|nr:thioesterase domain-containing protein [Streptomyces halstedii]NEA18769.1 hypothetical protein [Streptomyces halstedii]